jgi:hypothetical protein
MEKPADGLAESFALPVLCPFMRMESNSKNPDPPPESKVIG